MGRMKLNTVESGFPGTNDTLREGGDNLFDFNGRYGPRCPIKEGVAHGGRCGRLRDPMWFLGRGQELRMLLYISHPRPRKQRHQPWTTLLVNNLSSGMVQLQDHPAIGSDLMHRTRDPREALDERIIIRSHKKRRRERFGVHSRYARDDQAHAPLCEIAVKVHEKIRYLPLTCGCILESCRPYQAVLDFEWPYPTRTEHYGVFSVQS